MLACFFIKHCVANLLAIEYGDTLSPMKHAENEIKYNQANILVNI